MGWRLPLYSAGVLLLIFTQSALAQQEIFHVQYLKQNNLFTPAQIEDMIKDDRGFLWTLTPSAVQRFDGKNFKTFSFDDRCISVRQDRKGKIWLMTRQNIYWFVNDHEGFKVVPGTTKKEIYYRRMELGADHSVYFLTLRGLEQWNEKSRTVELSGVPPFSESGSFLILKSFGQYLYYRHKDFLFRYHTALRRLDSVKLSFPNYVSFINEDSVWARSGVGNTYLVCFKTKKATKVKATQFEQRFSDQNIFILGSISLGSGRHFVLVRHKGFFIYQSATNNFSPVQLFYEGKPLSGFQAFNIFYKEGSTTVWFPHDNGLVSFNPFQHGLNLMRSHYSNSNIEWSNEVKSFCEDQQANIWFSTTNGFCKWNTKTGKIKVWLPRQNAGDYLNYPSVRSIASDGDKIIIGQSEGGFWIFDPRTEHFQRPKFLPADTLLQKKMQNDFNSHGVQLRNGNFLAISRNLYLIEKGTHLVKELKFEGARRNRTAYEDEQGRIWFAGVGTICATDSNFKTLYILKDSVLGRWANAIVQIDKERFWLAAKTLYELEVRDNKLHIRPILPELKNAHISGLFKDSLGRIWMQHAEGLFRYIPQLQLLEKFDASDNAQNFYLSYSTAYRAKNGITYFGTLNGINYFIPENIPLQKERLQVHLLNVFINNDDSTFLINGSLPQLKYFQNALAIDFIAPHIFNQGRVKYRYRLKGEIEEWIHLGNNTSVRFSSLSAGDYDFEAEASLNGKDWFAMSHPLHFSISPPLWKTWWFISAMVLLFISLAVFLFRKRIHLIKKREAEKTELQKLRAAGYQAQLEAEQIINYFTTSMNNINTVEEVLWSVAKNCISKLGFEDCVIYLKDEERPVLVQKAAWGPKTTEDNRIINPIEIHLGKGIVGSVALTGKPEKIDDTTKDERYIVDDVRRFSELAVPIFEEGKLVGVIDSESSKKYFYTERHVNILTTIALHCGAKMATIKAEAKTKAAQIDALQNKQKALEASLQSMRLQMNPHFLFNALNSIQQMILSGEDTTATRFLSKFSKLLRTVLTNSSKEEVSLKEEIELLKLYIELESLRFKQSFTYSIHCDEDIDIEEVFVPALLLQPLVENAIWHGLMHKQNDRRLALSFLQFDTNYLLCRIEDNGLGREASACNGKSGQHTGKGLSVAEERLHLLNEKRGALNSLQIVDLKDENGHAAGTRIDIRLYH